MEIHTISTTNIHFREIEDAEFDNLGIIRKAKRIKNINIQNYETIVYTKKNYINPEFQRKTNQEINGINLYKNKLLLII